MGFTTGQAASGTWHLAPSVADGRDGARPSISIVRRDRARPSISIVGRHAGLSVITFIGFRRQAAQTDTAQCGAG